MGSKSDYNPVNDRGGHVVVSWKELTLIWGGCKKKPAFKNIFWDPKIIHCHQDGIWIPISTRGEIPPPTLSAAGEVIGDNLYVVCGSLGYLDFTNEIYRLDLKTMVWSKLEPNGTRPLKSAGMVSWTSGEKIFLFGGFGKNGKEEGKWYPESLELNPSSFSSCFVNNQLVYYDCQENSWHWPIVSGTVPSPRSGHAASLYSDSLKSVAFIFGGGEKWPISNSDLFIFDNNTMKWKSLHHVESSQAWPTARHDHTLTKTSSMEAVLFGGHSFDGCYYNIRRDCWKLDMKKVIHGGNEQDIWTKLDHHEKNGSRIVHKAIQEPNSQRVWILGGSDESNQCTNHIRALTLTAPSLKVLAMERVAKHVDVLATELEKLPKMDNLRRSVESMAEDKYVIS